MIQTDHNTATVLHGNSCLTHTHTHTHTTSDPLVNTDTLPVWWSDVCVCVCMCVCVCVDL